MLELVKTLCALPGPSGCEEEVARYIWNRVKPHCDTISTDAFGNILCTKKGRRSGGPRIMLCAHMDEVGVIVKSVNEDGFLKFGFIGGVDRRVCIGRKVLIGKDSVPGVIGVKAVHMVKKSEADNIPKTEDMYIDIGAADKDAALALVSPGDYGCFSPETVLFGDNMLKARAIDDRAGCAVLIKLLESELPVDTLFAFTAQEEVGTRGAFAASFTLEPEIALIVEGTTAADLPGVEEKARRICSPGAGVVIPFMDGATIYDRGLFERLRDLADKNDIPWQTKSYVSGGTDAGAVQRSRSGVRSAGVAVAVRYIHSPASVASVEDMENLYRLCRAFLESYGGADE